MCFYVNALAQSYADTVGRKYRFLKPDKNVIGNDSDALDRFYQQLYLLETKSTTRVSIAHIGDSHIQADFFSGMLRQKLQTEFGNAGRGLIFPYRVARTNEPTSYQSSSNVSWETKRNIFLDNPLPIGIGGITIKTMDSAAAIKLNVLDQGALDYSFTKLSIFQDKGPGVFDFMVYEGNDIIGFVNSNLSVGGEFMTSVLFDKPKKNITLKAYKRDSIQMYSQLYGILLENNEPGILYNSTGVNGAECRHCNASKNFFSQLTYLEPSLVIISLGTNEAYTKAFDRNRFNTHIDSLVKHVLRETPDANILFTTPADSYRRKKYKNPDMMVARNTIISYCTKNGYAYWDLYEIMGGMGSMSKWKLAGLAAPDKVHFSRGGYELQGKLLYSAIQNGYRSFKKRRHP